MVHLQQQITSFGLQVTQARRDVKAQAGIVGAWDSQLKALKTRADAVKDMLIGPGGIEDQLKALEKAVKFFWVVVIRLQKLKDKDAELMMKLDEDERKVVEQFQPLLKVIYPPDQERRASNDDYNKKRKLI